MYFSVIQREFLIELISEVEIKVINLTGQSKMRMRSLEGKGQRHFYMSVIGFSQNVEIRL